MLLRRLARYHAPSTLSITQFQRIICDRKLWVKIALCLQSKQSAILHQNAHYAIYAHKFQKFPR